MVWFVVGLIFLVLSFVTFLVVGFFTAPFTAAAIAYPRWTIPIVILLFVVYTTITGFLVLFVAKKFGKRKVI